MLEHVLGTVDAGAGGLADVVGDPDPRLRSGSFDLVVRAEEQTRRVTGGALVKNLGNDQWSVYLLDVAQVEKVVAREGLDAPTRDGGPGILGQLGLHFAAHAAGLGVAAMLLEGVTGGGNLVAKSLGLETSKAEAAAEKLVAGGVDPADTSRIRAETSHVPTALDAAEKAPHLESRSTLESRVGPSGEPVTTQAPPRAPERSFDRLELER